MFTTGIGALRLDRIDELTGPVMAPHSLLPTLPADAVVRHAGWFAPHFYDPTADALVLSLHGWVVRTGRHTVLMEACGGNHKHRPECPRVHQLDSPWLARLRAAGVEPEEIDFVFCSHLHVDHIGWFTELKDGRWVPTFPNAKYLMARREFDNWNPATRTLPPFVMQGSCFDDCVVPVLERGQALIVDDGHEIDDHLKVEASYGHTLGHCSLRASSDGETAIFCGDVVHSPIEMVYPDVNTHACEDQVAARVTRRRMLEEAAEHGHVLVPAHFPHPYSTVKVRRAGDGFLPVLDG